MECPAIFLDRDGVINRNRSDHVKSWTEFEFLPGVLEALKELSQLNWPVIVISNQAAIGRGLVSRQEVDEINSRMVEAVHLSGGRIDHVYYCPHRPDEGCDCRKPRPGMILQAAKEAGLDLPRSYLIGDAESDLLAAVAAGCQAVLVKTGRIPEKLVQIKEIYDYQIHIEDNLTCAVKWILQREKISKSISV